MRPAQGPLRPRARPPRGSALTAARWLASLVRRLRDAGVAISPAILLDAARALEACDLDPDPDLLRAVLRLTLARSRAEQAIFDEVYPRYMASHRPPPPNARRKALPRVASGGDAAPQAAGSSVGTGAPPPRTGASPPPRTGIPPGSRPGIAPAPGRDRTPPHGIRATAPPSPGSRGGAPPPGTEPPAARPGGDPQGHDRPPTSERSPRLAPFASEEELDAWLRALGSGEEGDARPTAHSPAQPGAGAPHPRPGQPRRVSAGGSPAPASVPGAGVAPGAYLAHALTDTLDPADEARLLQAVRALAEQAWWRRSRRSRRWRSGRVDVKATVSLSRRTGGVPFRVAHRRRRLRRARLLLLLDVSGSVRHAARLLLALAQAMHEAFSQARAFVFVNRPVEVTPLLAARELPTVEAWMRETPQVDWKAMSDFGHAFFGMLEDHDRVLRKDTLLVVMGDARNNRVDPMAWALREIRERVGHVIWLNPEAHARWNTGDSVMETYAPYCDLVERCERVADLRRVAERWAHLSARWR